MQNLLIFVYFRGFFPLARNRKTTLPVVPEPIKSTFYRGPGRAERSTPVFYLSGVQSCSDAKRKKLAGKSSFSKTTSDAPNFLALQFQGSRAFLKVILLPSNRVCVKNLIFCTNYQGRRLKISFRLAFLAKNRHQNEENKNSSWKAKTKVERERTLEK